MYCKPTSKYKIKNQPCAWHRWGTGCCGTAGYATIARLVNTFFSIEVSSSGARATFYAGTTTAPLIIRSAFSILLTSCRDSDVCLVSTTVCTWSAARNFCWNVTAELVRVRVLGEVTSQYRSGCNIFARDERECLTRRCGLELPTIYKYSGALYYSSVALNGCQIKIIPSSTRFHVVPRRVKLYSDR